jgi:hypothetical protein
VLPYLDVLRYWGALRYWDVFQHWGSSRRSDVSPYWVEKRSAETRWADSLTEIDSSTGPTSSNRRRRKIRLRHDHRLRRHDRRVRERPAKMRESPWKRQ